MSEASKKGRALELSVAAQIRRKGLDRGAKRMHRSGAIDHRKGDVFTSLPYSFEAKAVERINLWECWNQARDQARLGRPPVLVIGGEHRPELAVVDLDTLLNLFKIEQDYLAAIPERAPLAQRVLKAVSRHDRRKR